MPNPQIDNIVSMIQASSQPASNNCKITIRRNSQGEIAVEIEGAGNDIAEVAVECIHAAFHTPSSDPPPV